MKTWTVACAALIAMTAQAADYLSKPVRLLVPTGSPADALNHAAKAALAKIEAQDSQAWKQLIQGSGFVLLD